MSQQLTLTYYSDVLCIWAYIAQARVDEVARRFPNQVSIEYRFCSVFGDTAHKIGEGWADKGGYEGFAKHLHEAVANFDHISLHPDTWHSNRPVSSTPAHLVLKAVQRVDEDACNRYLTVLRSRFFNEGQDISRLPVLREALDAVEVPTADVLEAIDNGLAHADLEADRRAQQAQMVEGSPTFILNQGRQKLYGNVGYGIIEANINELLRSPVAGEASWC